MRNWNYESATRNWLQWGLLSFVFMIAGCRSAAKLNPDISSELANSAYAATQWKPTTFVDRVELQDGTGAMDADADLDFLATDSGLKYRVLRKSNGKKPTVDSTVTVHYRGWLNPAKVFDSSYERDEPTSFPLRNVIAGWTEGMQLVGEGGMIELWVPSRLGYGERGSPGSIPAHSDLHFIVELVSVD